MSEKRKLVRNTLVNGAAQVGSLVIGLVLMPILIRSFGKADYGVYLIAVSITAYAALMDLGVGVVLIKLTAEHAAKGEHDRVASLFSNGLAFYSVVGLVIAAGVALVGVLSHSIFKLDPGSGDLLRNLLFATAAISLVSWPLMTANYILQGFQRYVVTARTALVTLVATSLVSIAVIVTHQGPFVLVVGQGLANIAGLSYNMFAARRLVAGHRVSIARVEASVLKHIASFSWVIFIIQVCTLVIYQQTDRLIIGVFVGAAAVTFYEAAGKFQSLVVQMTAFANSAVLPTASRLGTEGSRDRLQVLFLRGTKYTLALLLPAIVTLMVLAKPIITRWLGADFALEALGAQVFLSHQLLTPSTAVGDNIVTGMGRMNKRLPFVVGILTIGNLVLSVILVQRIGIMGVILGTVIPHFIDFPFHMHFILDELQVPFKRLLKDVALPLYPLLAVPVGVGYALSLTPMMRSLSGVGVSAIISVGAYWVALFVFGLNATERDEVRGLYRAVVGRLSRQAQR